MSKDTDPSINNEKRQSIVIKPNDELIAIYKDVYIKLLERMQYNNIRGLDNRHLKALLADVKGILKSLSVDTRAWIDKNITDIYDTGVQIATSEITKIGMDMTGSSFAKLNRSAIEVLSDDMFNDLAMGINNVGRTIQTDIKRIAMQSVQNRLMFGQSTLQTTQDMYNEMVKNGLTVLKDRQGKRWNLMTYSTMVIRTKTREVVTSGTINTMLSAGSKYKDELLFDLVQISQHNGSCPICIPYQGKVYSISGKHPDYPKLIRITPFHPNCRHVTTPFFERLYTGDVDELRELSNN